MTNYTDQDTLIKVYLDIKMVCNRIPEVIFLYIEMKCANVENGGAN